MAKNEIAPVKTTELTKQLEGQFGIKVSMGDVANSLVVRRKRELREYREEISKAAENIQKQLTKKYHMLERELENVQAKTLKSHTSKLKAALKFTGLDLKPKSSCRSMNEKGPGVKIEINIVTETHYHGLPYTVTVPSAKCDGYRKDIDKLSKRLFNAQDQLNLIDTTLKDSTRLHEEAADCLTRGVINSAEDGENFMELLYDQMPTLERVEV